VTRVENASATGAPDSRLSRRNFAASVTEALFARKRTGVVITLDPVSSARTRVTLTNLGYAELAKAHPDHASEFVQTREYFTHAWSRVLAKLESHFASSAAPGAANPPADALDQPPSKTKSAG